MASDNRTVMEKVKDEIIPSAFSAGIGILGASFILGVDLSQSLNLFGMNVPTWGAIGGVIMGADMLAYASHDWVLEKIPAIQNSGFATAENKLLAPVLSGLGVYVLLREGVSTDVSLVNSFLLGGGSSIAGRYGYDTWEQMKQGK